MAAPGRFRRWVVRPLVWALAVLALAVVGVLAFLRSDLARERARELARARLSDTLGRPVTIGAVDFELLPLGLVLADVEIPSDRPGEPPLLRLRRARVEGELEGFRRTELVLHSVEIEGADVDLRFRPDGSDNIPRPRRRGAAQGETRLTIEGLRVADSSVTIAEQRARVNVAARAVAIRLAGLGGTDLGGSVVAQEVELELPDARPALFALAAKVALRRQKVEILHARVTGPDLAARVSGEVVFRPRTRVDLAAHVETSGAFVDRLGYLDGDVAGPAVFDGTFQWRGEAWGFRGDLVSPRLDLFGFRLEDVSGEVSGEEDTVRFDLARARFDGGEAHGALAVDLENKSYPARLEVGLVEVDLERVLERFEIPVAGLAGEVSGPFRYDFPMKDALAGQGQGDFEILPVAEPGERVAATGSVHLGLDAGRLSLPAIDLATPGQRITASGTYDLESSRGAFELEVQSEDLGELARLLPFLDREAIWVPRSGTAIASGRIEIAPGAFSADLDIAAAAYVSPGVTASRLAGRVVASDRAVEGLDLELERPGGRATLLGRVPIGADDAPGLDVVLTAEGWPVEEAGPWLPFELPVTGPLTGTVHLTGSIATPMGEIDVAVAPAVVAGLAVDRLEVEIELAPAAIEVRRAEMRAAAGVVAASGSLGRADESLDFTASSAGLDLAAAPLADFTAGRLAGTLAWNGRAGGTLARPAIELAGEVAGLAVGGLQLEEEAPGRLAASWRDERLAVEVELPGLLRVAGGGEMSAAGRVALELDVASQRIDRIAALVAAGRVEGIEGSLAGRISIAGAPGEPLQAALVVPELAFRYAGRELVSLEPVRAELVPGGVAIRSIYLGLPGSDDELFATGGVFFEEPPRLDLRFQASLAASWLRPLLADLDVDGRVDFLAVLRGTTERPELNGQAELSDARFIPPGIPHTVDRGGALVLFYPRAIVLDHLAAEFAGGDLRAKGRVELPESGEISYRFEGTLRRVAVRWPAGWLLGGDGDLLLASTPEGRQVRGELRLDRLYYLQDVSLSPAQIAQRVLARSRVEVAETDDVLSTTYLAVALSAPHALRVRNNLADLSGGGELTLRGTLARPVIFGEIDVDPGGTVTYAGNTYTLERARLTFANPSQIDPLLDVVARSRIDQYDVTVRLGGTLARLETGFGSDPPLPDLDVLALISTGAPLEAGTRAIRDPAAEASGATAAESILYGQAASLLTARVNRLFGLDKLRVDPLTSGEAISSARVTVGKRISREVYVTYSIDPSSTAQQILQVEWRLTDHLVLVLTQNGNESYAVDARWESRY